jgi:hypothetical protein
VAGDLLLDTGALVSLIDRSQRDHEVCVRFAGTDLVFTTDRRDFGVYRIRGRRRFRIVPD